MQKISEKLTLAQMSKDIQALTETVHAHSRDDGEFQAKTRRTDVSIQHLLQSITNKLDQKHPDYINRNVEERLGTMEKKMEPLLEIYNGFIFGRKAVIWTSGAVGAIALIVGAVVAFIRFVK